MSDFGLADMRMPLIQQQEATQTGLQQQQGQQQQQQVYGRGGPCPQSPASGYSSPLFVCENANDTPSGDVLTMRRGSASSISGRLFGQRSAADQQQLCDSMESSTTAAAGGSSTTAAGGGSGMPVGVDNLAGGGTLAYMAPEVFDGEPTKEADVWSFGVM